jgi:hypothetical protein
MEKLYVLVAGDSSIPVKFYGPFVSRETATKFAELLDVNSWLVELHSPLEEGFSTCPGCGVFTFHSKISILKNDHCQNCKKIMYEEFDEIETMGC